MAKTETMKRFGLFICCGLIYQFCFGQGPSIKDITDLLDFNPTRLESHLQKKGFKRTYQFVSDDISPLAFTRTEKIDSINSIARSFRIINQVSGYKLRYQTTSSEEYTSLKEDLKKSGFIYCPKTEANSTEPVLYQKQTFTIESTIQKEDSSYVYILDAEKIALPRLRDIIYAEDLLQLNSHECLTELFGKDNVRKDEFYYSPADSNRCTVLYPNTNREAIFIWNDEENMRELSFIIIGGHLKTGDKIDNVNQIKHSAWKSKQGLFCGMSLLEIQELNRQPVKFYNWNTESAGYLTPQNKGQLDFEQMGMVLNCLNCNYVDNVKTNILQSDRALDENQKVFLATMIVLPEKKKQESMISRKK
jgi:hypothetical protein